MVPSLSVLMTSVCYNVLTYAAHKIVCVVKDNIIVHRDDEKIKLQLWDTAGQERYLRITTAYFLGAKGFIVMFDLTSQDSFQSVRQW